MGNPGLLRRKRWWLLAIIVLAILAAALLPAALPPNFYEDYHGYYCTKCGQLRKVTEFVEVSTGKTVWRREKLEPTALSKWCDQHFGTPCDHQWHGLDDSRQYCFCLFGRRLVSLNGESSSRPMPSLIWLDAHDRDELNRLFQEDPRKCREYIQAQLTAGK